jgi:predicted nucleotidyltransferase
MHRDEAERRTILRGLVGSTVHGLSVSDGNDDRDEMGVCLEPIQYAAGLGNFEQFIYRTAAEREGKHDAKSRAGDLDLVIYSLRKYVRLALDGNPTILNLLFTPRQDLVCIDARGERLRELAPFIASRRAGGRFLGYLTAQRQRLIGERGGKDVRRPELENKYGFDSKYAMHMLRLSFQGIEFMQTGVITLPMPEPERSFVRSVRLGEVPLQDVLTKCGELERQLADLRDTSPLPEHPDTKRVEAFMIDCYYGMWQSDMMARDIERNRAIREHVTAGSQ